MDKSQTSSPVLLDSLTDSGPDSGPDPGPDSGPDSGPHDVLVVGGGPAGLQAALTAARVHRSVVLLDAGQHRNDPADAMHNVIGLDGTAPAELRARAHAELAALGTVTVLAARVERLAPEGPEERPDAFTATLDDGRSVRGRTLVLATGVRDRLPDIPGLAEAFGTLVHHCPFCHGHELAGRRIAVLDSPRAAHLATLLRPIAAEVVIVAGLRTLSRDGECAVLDAEHGAGVYGGVFVATEIEPGAGFAADLGLVLNPSGLVRIDIMGRTSLPGVFAAGDGAHHPDLPQPLGSVVAAMAAGQVAAAGCLAHLLAPAPV